MKKSIKKITSIFLAVLIMALMPLSVYASSTSKSPFSSYTYTHQTQHDGKKIYHGLDLSYHNDTLDFAKLKKAGVEFVILRIGYRGYGKSGTIMNDTKFDEYYNAAKKEGLLIGGYFYSQALNETEAVAEADRTLNNIAGKEFDLPIAFDYEFAGVSDGRFDLAWRNGELNKTKCTNNAIAFCNRIKSKGYKAMLYCNPDFLQNVIDYPKVENAGYPLWLAHYTTNTKVAYNFSIWQYSEKGTVTGFDGKKFDANFMYGDDLLNDENDNYITLNPPTLSFVSNTTTSVKIKWNAVKSVDGYTVYRYKNSTWTAVDDVTATSYTLSDLTSATNYSIRVKSFVQRGRERFYSPYSSTLKVTTIPAKVTNVKSSSRTDKEITLTWDKIGSPTSYKVYKYDAVDGKYKFVKSSTTNTITISSLKAHTLYKFKVEAIKDNGVKTYVGAQSNAFGIYTRYSGPTPTAVSSPSTKKIKLTWKTSTKFDGYQVQWSTYSDFSANTKSVTVADPTAVTKTVITAREKYKYYIRVRGYTLNNGTKFYSAWSKGLSVTTK